MIDRAERLTKDIIGDRASQVISPGNMDGGMSTIAEKSMGCIFKGGTTTINQVVDYDEVPTDKGLVLQDGPATMGILSPVLLQAASSSCFSPPGRGPLLAFWPSR
jgi:altronate dehydratase